MFRLSIILLFALAIFVSCQKSDIDKEARTPGEIAFRSSCQTCHILPKATMKTDAEWPAMVSRYGEKAKLTDTQIKDIIIYLTANN